MGWFWALWASPEARVFMGTIGLTVHLCSLQFMAQVLEDLSRVYLIYDFSFGSS
jgi:hypothetical protein